MRPFRLSRRALLRGAGGIADRAAHARGDGRALGAGAQPPGPPKRLVVFFTPNATNDPAEFMPQQTGTNFTLGKETRPLEPLRDKLLVLSGINMESAKKDDGDHHSIGMSHMLTGTRWVPAVGYEKPGGDQFTVGFAGGISVDQHIAKKVGTTTRFPSLEFGVISISDYGVHPFSRMISSGPNQPVPAEDDPAAMFKRVFTDGTVVAGTTVEQAHCPAPERARSACTDDFMRLEPRLGTKDRQKVDAHLTAVRNLEARLTRVGPRWRAVPKTFTTTGNPLDKANIPGHRQAANGFADLGSAVRCHAGRLAAVVVGALASHATRGWTSPTAPHPIARRSERRSVADQHLVRAAARLPRQLPSRGRRGQWPEFARQHGHLLVRRVRGRVRSQLQ